MLCPGTFFGLSKVSHRDLYFMIFGLLVDPQVKFDNFHRSLSEYANYGVWSAATLQNFGYLDLNPKNCGIVDHAAPESCQKSFPR